MRDRRWVVASDPGFEEVEWRQEDDAVDSRDQENALGEFHCGSFAPSGLDQAGVLHK